MIYQGDGFPTVPFLRVSKRSERCYNVFDSGRGPHRIETNELDL